MGIVIKQSGIASVITYLGATIGFVNNIILFPAFLSTEEIGLFRALPSAAFMLVPIAQLGMSNTLIKYFPEFNRKKEGLKQLLTFVMISLAIGFVITTIGLFILRFEISLLFEKNSPLFNDYFYVTTLLIFILSVYTLLESYCRIFLKIIAPNIIKEILVRVISSVYVGLYFLQWISFEHLINGLIVIYGFALLILIGYIIDIGEFKFSRQLDNFNKPILKKIASYSAYGIIGSGSGYIILNIDQVMISSLLGLEENGIYTTAFYFAVMIDITRRVISQVTTPMVSNYFDEGDIGNIKKIYQQSSINQMVIGCWIFIGIVCNIDSVYALMPNGEIYSAGKTIIYIIGASKLIDMSFANNSEIITISNYYRFNVATMVILGALMIVFNMILIPIYGINGAAIATFVAVLIFNMIKLIFIKVKLGIIPFTTNNLTLLGVSIVFLFIGIWVPKLENAMFDLILRSIILTALFFASVFGLKISNEINGILLKVTQRFR